MKTLRKLLTVIFILTTVPFAWTSPVVAGTNSAADYNCASQNLIPLAQCEALKSFYIATNGDSWTLKDPSKKWFTPGTRPCGLSEVWEGIWCYHVGEEPYAIREILLSEHNLSGTIPADFFSAPWPYLAVLKLNFNNLSGPLPEHLPVSLVDIYLNSNHFSGSVPAYLSTLTKATNIGLNNNRLSGNIPGSLARSNWAIKNFNVSQNMLSADKDDTVLNSWLQKVSGAWKDRQTIYPDNVKMTVTSPTSVHLSWDPIIYTLFEGRYEVGFRKFTDAEFTFQPANATASKTDTDINISGLEEGRTYYFTVRTVSTDTYSGVDWVSAGSPQIAIYGPDVRLTYLPALRK